MRNVYDEQMNERVGVNYNHNQLGTANFPERFCFCFVFLVSTIENKEKKKMLIFR